MTKMVSGVTIAVSVAICGAKASLIIGDELLARDIKVVPVDEPAPSPSISHSYNVHGESWRNKGKMPWRKC